MIQTGNVLGKAVLKAVDATAFLPCIRETKCLSFQSSSHLMACRHLPSRRPSYYRAPRQTPLGPSAPVMADRTRNVTERAIMLHTENRQTVKKEYA